MAKERENRRGRLDLVRDDGTTQNVYVSISRLSKASTFFAALFKYTRPKNSATSGSCIFGLEVGDVDASFLAKLLKFVEGKPLDLTHENVGLALLFADRWLLTEVLFEVAAFLCARMSCATAVLETKGRPVGKKCRAFVEQEVQRSVHEIAEVGEVRVHPRKAARVQQIVKLIKAAEDYGLTTEVVDKLPLLYRQGLQYLAKELPVLLRTPALASFPKDLTRQFVAAFKRTHFKASLVQAESCRRWGDWRYAIERLPCCPHDPDQRALAEDLRNYVLGQIVQTLSERLLRDGSFCHLKRNRRDRRVFLDILVEAISELDKELRQKPTVHEEEKWTRCGGPKLWIGQGQQVEVSMARGMECISRFLSISINSAVSVLKDEKRSDSTLNRCLYDIAQGLKYIASIKKYAHWTDSEPILDEMQAKAIYRLSKELPYLMTTAAFRLLPKAYLPELATGYRESVNWVNGIRQWQQCTRAITHLACFPWRIEEKKLAETLKTHVRTVLVLYFPDLLREIETDYKHMSKKDRCVYFKVLTEVASCLNPQNCLEVYTELECLLARFQEDWDAEHGWFWGHESDQDVREISALLKPIRNSVGAYCKRHFKAVRQSYAYALLSEEEQSGRAVIAGACPTASGIIVDGTVRWSPRERRPRFAKRVPRQNTAASSAKGLDFAAVKMTEKNPTVLLSGASTGIGESTAVMLAEKGWIVFAGIRKEKDAEKLAKHHTNIRPVFLDVTKPAQIGEVIEQVRAAVGTDGLDALVNNAGIGMFAPMEFVPMEDVIQQFDINVYGMIRLTQAALPLIRQGTPGRIVNVGSIGHHIRPPFWTMYGATKGAMECVSESLRREVAPFGVKVTLVKPGPVKTCFEATAFSFIDEIKEKFPPGTECHKYYGWLLDNMSKGTENAQKLSVEPELVARVIYRQLVARNPKNIVCDTWTSWIMVQLMYWLPTSVVDYVLRSMFV